MSARELAQQLKTRFGDLISEPAEFRGEITLQLSDANRIAEVCDFAKKQLGFDFLVDVSSLDHYGSDPRFTVVYHLYGYGHRCSLRIKTDVGEEASELPTVTGVWKTADSERAHVISPPCFAQSPFPCPLSRVFAREVRGRCCSRHWGG